MKRYRFTVAAKLSKTGTRQLLSNIIATGIVDAKNQVKEIVERFLLENHTWLVQKLTK